MYMQCLCMQVCVCVCVCLIIFVNFMCLYGTALSAVVVFGLVAWRASSIVDIKRCRSATASMRFRIRKTLCIATFVGRGFCHYFLNEIKSFHTISGLINEFSEYSHSLYSNTKWPMCALFTYAICAFAALQTNP